MPAPNPLAPLTPLARRIRASDQSAFADVFAALREPLLRYAHGIVGDGDAAHDLVQDVFLALWEGRAGLDPDVSLPPFLYRMARNRALNHLRDRRLHDAKHDGLRLEAAVGEEHADGLDAEALGTRLQTWIGALPERQREALTLTRERGLSHHEAAAVMNVSPRTLNNHIVRALARLHARIALYAPDLVRPSHR